MPENEPEPLIPLSEVPDLAWFPRRPGLSTVHRWAATGCGGVVLRTIRFGSARCTTATWLMEFFEGCETKKSPDPFRTPAKRERERKAAESRLDEAGIK